MNISEYPGKEDRAARKAFVAVHGLPDGVYHGESAYVNWGCRDDECMEAHANHARDQRDDRLARTEANGGIAPTTLHNRNTRRNWGCECDLCRGDYNSYMSSTRKSRAKAA